MTLVCGGWTTAVTQQFGDATEYNCAAQKYDVLLLFL